MPTNHKKQLLFQGIVVGCVSAPFLAGFYMYFGWVLLIIISVCAMASKALSIKLRLWGFLLSSLIITLGMWYAVFPKV